MKRYIVTQQGQIEQQLTADEITARETEIASFEAGATRRQKLAQIAALEAQVTQRRIREAIEGTDNGWLANIDQQITQIRGSL